MTRPGTRIPLDEDDDEALAQRIGETARRQGIPSLTPSGAPSSAAPPSAARKPAERRPVKLEVSADLFTALTVAAAERRVTKRYLILTALREAGYPVSEEDLAEDGRRIRGSRTS